MINPSKLNFGNTQWGSKMNPSSSFKSNQPQEEDEEDLFKFTTRQDVMKKIDTDYSWIKDYRQQSPEFQNPKTRSFLDRTVDLLSVGQYVTMGAIRGLTSGKFDPIEGAIGGLIASNPFGDGYEEGEHFFSEVVGDLGWNPTSTAGRVAKGVVGLAGDIFLDPLTYVTFGLGGVIKGTGKSAIKASTYIDDVAKTMGHTATSFTELGQKLFKEAIDNGVTPDMAMKLSNDSVNSIKMGYRSIRNGLSSKDAIDIISKNSSKFGLIDDSIDVAKESERLVKKYNKLVGINTTSRGATVSLANAPFGKKIFGKYADASFEIASPEAMRAIGDNIGMGEQFSRLRKTIHGGEFGKLFSNNHMLYKSAQSNPEGMYYVMKYLDMTRGQGAKLRMSQKAVKEACEANGFNDLTPADHKAIIEVMEDSSQFNYVRTVLDKMDMKEVTDYMKGIEADKIVFTNRLSEIDFNRQKLKELLDGDYSDFHDEVSNIKSIDEQQTFLKSKIDVLKEDLLSKITNIESMKITGMRANDEFSQRVKEVSELFDMSDVRKSTDNIDSKISKIADESDVLDDDFIGKLSDEDATSFMKTFIADTKAKIKDMPIIEDDIISDAVNQVKDVVKNMTTKQNRMFSDMLDSLPIEEKYAQIIASNVYGTVRKLSPEDSKSFFEGRFRSVMGDIRNQTEAIRSDEPFNAQGIIDSIEGYIKEYKSVEGALSDDIKGAYQNTIDSLQSKYMDKDLKFSESIRLESAEQLKSSRNGWANNIRKELKEKGYVSYRSKKSAEKLADQLGLHVENVGNEFRVVHTPLPHMIHDGGDYIIRNLNDYSNLKQTVIGIKDSNFSRKSKDFDNQFVRSVSKTFFGDERLLSTDLMEVRVKELANLLGDKDKLVAHVNKHIYDYSGKSHGIRSYLADVFGYSANKNTIFSGRQSIRGTRDAMFKEIRDRVTHERSINPLLDKNKSDFEMYEALVDVSGTQIKTIDDLKMALKNNTKPQYTSDIASLKEKIPKYGDDLQTPNDFFYSIPQHIRDDIDVVALYHNLNDKVIQIQTIENVMKNFDNATLKGIFEERATGSIKTAIDDFENVTDNITSGDALASKFEPTTVNEIADHNRIIGEVKKSKTYKAHESGTKYVTRDKKGILYKRVVEIMYKDKGSEVHKAVVEKSKAMLDKVKNTSKTIKESIKNDSEFGKLFIDEPKRTFDKDKLFKTKDKFEPKNKTLKDNDFRVLEDGSVERFENNVHIPLTDKNVFELRDKFKAEIQIKKDAGIGTADVDAKLERLKKLYKSWKRADKIMFDIHAGEVSPVKNINRTLKAQINKNIDDGLMTLLNTKEYSQINNHNIKNYYIDEFGDTIFKPVGQYTQEELSHVLRDAEKFIKNPDTFFKNQEKVFNQNKLKDAVKTITDNSKSRSNYYNIKKIFNEFVSDSNNIGKSADEIVDAIENVNPDTIKEIVNASPMAKRQMMEINSFKADMNYINKELQSVSLDEASKAKLKSEAEFDFGVSKLNIEKEIAKLEVQKKIHKDAINASQRYKDKDELLKLNKAYDETVQKIEDIERMIQYPMDIVSHLESIPGSLFAKKHQFAEDALNRNAKMIYEMRDDLSDPMKNIIRNMRETFLNIGREEVSIGKMSKEQFDNMAYSYMPHIMTAEGKKLLDEFGYKEKVFKTIPGFYEEMGFGRKFNPFAKERMLKQIKGADGELINNPTITELNAYFNREFPEIMKGKNAFVEDLKELYMSRAIKHTELMYDNEYMNSMMSMFGTPIGRSTGFNPTLKTYTPVQGKKMAMNYGQLKNFMFSMSSEKRMLGIKLQILANGKELGVKSPRELMQKHPAIYHDISEKALRESLDYFGLPEGTLKDLATPFIELNPEQIAKFIDSKPHMMKVGDQKKLTHASSFMHEIDDVIVEQANRQRKIRIAKNNNEMLDLYDKFLHFIKINQTTITPGFHARNKMSNMFNNWLEIGSDVFDKELNKMTMNAILKNGDVEGGINIVREGKTTHMTTRDLYEEARRYNVIGEGFYESEIGVASEFGKGYLSRVLPKHADPTDMKNFKPYQWGAKAGTIVENHDRFLHFVAQVRSGKSFEEAGESAIKHLFDYSDLTAFEQSVMKRIFPYYTWIRKNTPLQVEMMLERPEKYRNINKVFNSLSAMVKSEDRLNDSDIPEYAQDWVQTPFNVTNKYGDKESILWNPNMPYQGVGDLLKPKTILSSISPIIKTPVEQVINQNIFTGKPIVKRGEGGEVASRVNHVLSNFTLYNVSKNVATAETSDELGIEALSRIAGIKTGGFKKRTTDTSKGQIEKKRNDIIAERSK